MNFKETRAQELKDRINKANMRRLAGINITEAVKPKKKNSEEIKGLDGPYSTNKRKKIYFDPKEKRYYDHGSDHYVDLDHDEEDPRAKAMQKASQADESVEDTTQSHELPNGTRTTFNNIPLNTHFTFDNSNGDGHDGESFIKSGKFAAWEIIKGHKQPQQCQFNGDSEVVVMSDNKSPNNVDQLLDKQAAEKSQSLMGRIKSHLGFGESVESKDVVVSETLLKELEELENEFDKHSTSSYYDSEASRKLKYKLPKDVKKACLDRIQQLKDAMDIEDEKGYNDKSVKEQGIECIEHILQNLSSNDEEGYKQAVVYMDTLMSILVDLLPAQLIKYLRQGRS